jgi:hypothetical protein
MLVAAKAVKEVGDFLLWVFLAGVGGHCGSSYWIQILVLVRAIWDGREPADKASVTGDVPAWSKRVWFV